MYAAFMNFEKSSNRVNRQEAWKVLKQYRVNEKLLKAVQNLHDAAKAILYTEKELGSLISTSG